MTLITYMKHALTAVEDWKIKIGEIEEMLSTVPETERLHVQQALEEIKKELKAVEQKLSSVTINIRREQYELFTQEQKKQIEPLLESIKQRFKELRKKYGYMFRE